MPAWLISRIRLAEERALGRVQPGRRLVEEEYLRFGDTRACDRHELPLALAELAGRPVAQVLDADARQRPADRVVAMVAVGAEHRDAQVLLDRQVVVQLDGLERPGHAGAHPGVRRQARDVGAAEADLAARRREAGDRVDHAGLAGTVGTDEADDRAGRHVERHVRDRHHAAVADGQRLHLQRGPADRIGHRRRVGRAVGGRVRRLGARLDRSGVERAARASQSATR